MDAPAHGPPFAGYQAEIFLHGMGGTKPEHPIAIGELERLVEERLSDPRATAYVFGGAGREETMRSNLEAFRRWRIVPRMLRDVSERDLSTTVLGTAMPAPVLLAPIGVQSIVHPDGELAVARAAAAVGLPMTLSTVASFALEEVAEAGGGPKWFQLYCRAAASSPRAWSTAPSAPATRRSCSPSTPSCRAGSRATSRAPGSRSSKGSGSPTTPPTRSFAMPWRSRPRTTRRQRSASSWPSSRTPS